MERTHALTTLRHRDFLLLWCGQLISATGDMMQSIALAWNIYVVTGSPLMVGLLGPFRAVPSMLLTLYGGAFADVMDRKRLILITNVIQMGVTSILVAASFTGHVSVWLLFAIAFMGGATAAFDRPARVALIPNVVPPNELANAFTLLTLLRQVASIAGPGLGGIAIASVGLGATYLANGVSFLGVIVAVLLMGPVPMVAAAPGSSWERIVDGLRFAWTEPILLLPLVIDGLTRLVVTNQPLLPILASDVFRLGPQGLGWLGTASSAGAVMGGLAIGTGRYGRHPLRLMVAGYLLEACFLIGLGLSPLLIGAGRMTGFSVAMLMLFGTGVCDVLSEVSRTTVAQLKTPDELRGRVTALTSIVTGSFPQLGQLEMGGLAAAFGPVAAPVFGGFAAILITLACLAPRRGRRQVLDYSFSSALEPEAAVT